MTFDPRQVRAEQVERFKRLVHEGGRGWDAYARDEAKKMAEADPTLFGNFPDAVDAEIKTRNNNRSTTR